MKRIGIYAGTFDPVHAGHVAFALQAVQRAGLNKLYFLPERRPRHKKGVEHFGHRVAMLKQSAKPHPKFAVLELDDISLSVERTLPRLQREFPDDQLVFLFGSDTVKHLTDWPLFNQLLASSELVIGIRDQDDQTELEQMIANWPTLPKASTIFSSYAPTISSSEVRDGLRRRQHVAGKLPSVERYSNRNWLYVSAA